MDIFLSINNREQVLHLPIVPENIPTLEASNNNESFSTIGKSDLNLLGNKGLKSTAIETFWPNKEYPYAKSRTYTGDEFVEIIESWRGRKLPIRYVVTNKEGKEVINMAVSIESFSYSYDKAGDVQYSLGLKEFPIL